MSLIPRNTLHRWAPLIRETISIFYRFMQVIVWMYITIYIVALLPVRVSFYSMHFTLIWVTVVYYIQFTLVWVYDGVYKFIFLYIYLFKFMLKMWLCKVVCLSALMTTLLPGWDVVHTLVALYYSVTWELLHFGLLV